MHQSGRYLYYEDRKLQALVLPYEGGMAMYVVLPAARTDPQQFEDSLSSSAWETRLARFEQVLGTIQMPRFRLDYRARLEPALKALGMERAFDRDRAEFEWHPNRSSSSLDRPGFASVNRGGERRGYGGRGSYRHLHAGFFSKKPAPASSLPDDRRSSVFRCNPRRKLGNDSVYGMGRRPRVRSAVMTGAGPCSSALKAAAP